MTVSAVWSPGRCSSTYRVVRSTRVPIAELLPCPGSGRLPSAWARPGWRPRGPLGDLQRILERPPTLGRHDRSRLARRPAGGQPFLQVSAQAPTGLDIQAAVDRLVTRPGSPAIGMIFTQGPRDQPRGPSLVHPLGDLLAQPLLVELDSWDAEPWQGRYYGPAHETPRTCPRPIATAIRASDQPRSSPCWIEIRSSRLTPRPSRPARIVHHPQAVPPARPQQSHPGSLNPPLTDRRERHPAHHEHLQHRHPRRHGVQPIPPLLQRPRHPDAMLLARPTLPGAPCAASSSRSKAENAVAGKTPVKRNRFVRLTGATKVNRALEGQEPVPGRDQGLRHQPPRPRPGARDQRLLPAAERREVLPDEQDRSGRPIDLSPHPRVDRGLPDDRVRRWP